MTKQTYIYIVSGLLGVALLSGLYVQGKNKDLPSDLPPWQAIFLSDGQVYFGHIENYNNRFYKLSHIYYLKYGSSLQQTTSDTTDQKLNLIKLGGELHGPEDLMYIDKNKIMFIENLKSSSPVVQGIEKSN